MYGVNSLIGRAPGCELGRCGFKSHLTPFIIKIIHNIFFTITDNYYISIMKNLINETNLDLLPKKGHIFNGDRWECISGSDYHPIDKIWPHKRIRRICDAFIGKSFDDAFSKFCKEVPDYQQKFFLDEFDINYFPDYVLDDNGNIQKTFRENPSKTVYFYSDDFKTEKRHKKTGVKESEWPWMDKRYNKEDYGYVIISGYELKFSSKNDPEYKRLCADQQKRIKSLNRKKEKELTEKAYSFISKEDIEILKEKILDKDKIERKGFDYLTSFRSDGAIHPDLIKERHLVHKKAM